MLLLAWFISSALALVSVSEARQFPLPDFGFPLNYGFPRPDSFNGLPNGPHYAEELHLRSLASETFVSLSHPAFPSHGVRIKRTQICNETAPAYTGYLDVDGGAKHLFFYFFESRSDPDTDDVIMWINGGPGCSSSLGLFMELGPCIMGADPMAENATFRNPFSWNTNANLFFLDQPVGVGYSYADYGEKISTTPAAAKNIAAFLTIFFETFKQFKGRAFHMAGESYGGRYIPVFASEVVDQNARAEAQGISRINLQSVLIGNGCTDTPSMLLSYYDISCTAASIEPVLDISTCVRMKEAVSRSAALLKRECIDRFDDIGCTGANTMIENEIIQPFYASGRNPYDVSSMCDGPIEETLCYPIINRIEKYLNRLDIRKQLGVQDFKGNFTGCNYDVNGDFGRHLDSFAPTPYYVAGLLERGIKVLAYIGTYDWICNHVGNLRWANALEWSEQESFRTRPLKPWTIDHKAVGLTKSAGNFTYLTIFEAGHMVPYDKPKEALVMLQRWLAGKSFIEA